MRLHFIIITGLVLITAAVTFNAVRQSLFSQAMTLPTMQSPLESTTPVAETTKTITTRHVPQAAPQFTFSATIPAVWEAEAIPATQAISIYDPAAPGETTLEKSQLFIRHFSASDFLTLPTVTIHTREELRIANRPAVQYDIEKKAAVTQFPNQPAWRSERHIVTDIRASDTNPSVFYVIAKRPDLSIEIYNDFLQSYTISN